MTDDRFKEITEILKSGTTTEIKKIKKEELLEYTQKLIDIINSGAGEPEAVPVIQEEVGESDSVDLISRLREELETSIKNGNLIDGKLHTAEAALEEKSKAFDQLQAKFAKLQGNRNNISWGLIFAIAIIIILLFV